MSALNQSLAKKLNALKVNEFSNTVTTSISNRQSLDMTQFNSGNQTTTYTEFTASSDDIGPDAGLTTSSTAAITKFDATTGETTQDLYNRFITPSGIGAESGPGYNDRKLILKGPSSSAYDGLVDPYAPQPFTLDAETQSDMAASLAEFQKNIN
mgnify:FL=1